MPNYRRGRVAGGTYFFTVTLRNRRAATLTNNIDLLRTAVRRVRAHHPFEIDACVVLPDHLHCIWTLPPDDDRYSLRWRLIKSIVSKGLPPAERRPRKLCVRSERGIWQRRFWEHTIRDDRDYARHLDYIHFNPVKHGYVPRAADWPYSTFHTYVRDGVLPLDWAEDVGELGSAGE
jgi:putative transposase